MATNVGMLGSLVITSGLTLKCSHVEFKMSGGWNVITGWYYIREYFDFGLLVSLSVKSSRSNKWHRKKSVYYLTKM